MLAHLFSKTNKKKKIKKDRELYSARKNVF